MDIPDSSSIVQNTTGPCVLLTGRAPLDTYREILLSARLFAQYYMYEISSECYEF